MEWIEFFRARPVLIVIVFIVAVAALVIGTIAISMKKAGMSLRPIIWFAGFFGMIAGPQLLFHIVRETGPSKQWSVQPEALRVAGGRFLHPELVFGPGVDPALVQDATRIFGSVLEHASVAQLAFFPTGETALVAEFRTPAGALEAMRGYHVFFQTSDESGDEYSGWVARRLSGDYVRTQVAQNVFLAWTGPDGRSVNARRDAIPALVPPVQTATTRLLEDKRLLGGWIVVNLILVVLWFFKGAAWATACPAATVAPITAAQLEQRLLSINSFNVPMSVSRYANEIEVMWREHEARRPHRLRMTLDEEANAVRVREYWTDVDWPSDMNFDRIPWRTSNGIRFFDYRSTRTPGTNPHELKQAVISVVTGSGWTWKPVFLESPVWLRWAVE
jgi:hypothetical protein